MKVKRLHIAVLIVAIVGISGVAMLALQPKPTGEIVYSDSLLVKVGDEEITAKEVDEQYEKIPDEIKNNVTRDDVLKSMIDSELILQQAQRKNLEAEDSEAELYIEQVKFAYGLTNETFQSELQNQGISLDEYKTSVKQQLTVSKLLNSELKLNQTSASEQEIQDYIGARPEFQDFYEEGDPDFIAQLESKVKLIIIQEKQKNLIDDYIAKLRAENIEGGTP